MVEAQAIVDTQDAAPWLKYIKKEDREAADMPDRQREMYKILDQAEEIFENRTQLDKIGEDADQQYEAYQKGTMVVATAFIKDFTTEVFKKFRTEIPRHAPILQPIVSVRLEDRKDDMEVYFFRMTMPPMVSNRSFFATHMQLEHDDGTVTVVMTSKGNEEYQVKNANDIYWDAFRETDQVSAVNQSQ